ncbi:MAG: DUF445 family protein [Kiritimatiellae bacterium]|nr:DUF445 family protein [Kiritimatiellia bacterium]
MFGLKAFFRKRREVIAKSKGITKVFAYGETVCFPISVSVIAILAAHALLSLAKPLLERFGAGVEILPLPSWFTAVFVAAAIGYLTNYIAIQMLYYPVSAEDLGEGRAPARPNEREALSKSRFLSAVTLGFWKKGLIPRNKDKIARQMGRVAEERFVTSENIAYLVPKLGNLFLSRNAAGKIRGMEFLRQLAVAHKDEVADILQWIGRDVVTGDNYQTIRKLLAKVGRSETFANALAAALFDYMEQNPESIASFVREMVSGFTDAQTSKADRSGSLWDRLKAGTTGFILELVANIGYPQIRSFLEDYARDPQHREQLRERLASLLPIFCDKVAEKIVSDPQSLSQLVSGDFVSQLIHIDIADDRFWDMIGEKVVPGLQGAIDSAFAAIPKDQFAKFFTGGHHIAGMVERTVMDMKLLDFYAMLDDIMAEHLGAIQVFGFILGAAIGYVQYSVSMIAPGRSTLPYLLIGIPLLALTMIKACTALRKRA